MVRIGHVDLGQGPGIVAAIGADPIPTASKARSMGAHILEVRIDLLGIKDEKELLLLLDELHELVGLPIIVTNRCQKEGGHWDGSEEARVELLVSALTRVDAVDVELSAPLRSRVVDAARSLDKVLIISSHDFRATPPASVMTAIMQQAMVAGADIAKLAVTPNSTADTLALLTVTQETDFPVSTIAMGKLGSHTRVVAPIYGSVLTYGAVEDAVAPGQLRIDELKHCMEVLI
ncbi:MAG: type I 3-dehydroquinate dehydratase [Methanosarcinales archaeon]|nr:type I 3-dehydroquinate dehydratase [Methanosarcinales archaeon]